MPRSYTYKVIMLNPVDSSQIIYQSEFRSVSAIAKALNEKGIRISKQSLDLIIYDPQKSKRPANTRFDNIEVIRIQN